MSPARPIEIVATFRKENECPAQGIFKHEILSRYRDLHSACESL